MSVDFSIVVCAHNPLKSVFKRCLAAIAELQGVANCAEIIIVDNNSSLPLTQESYVVDFIQGGSGRRAVVHEPRLGLTFARLAGFRASCGGCVIYFDDDNLPAADYLKGVRELAERYRDVSVWGPGLVEVEWEAGTPQWIKGYAGVFQAKNRSYEEFGRVIGWPSFFPAGTGMVVSRDVLTEYANQVEHGRLSATDRCGRRMTSGGDGQIVWTAVKMGRCAGTSPKLRLIHFTSREKAKLSYICRVVFGVYASGQTTLAEAFPEEKKRIEAALESPWRINCQILAQVLKSLFLLRIRSGVVSFTSQIGENYGRFEAAGKHPPKLVSMLASWFGYV